MTTCTFDLKFTYILLGWEETTSDSRILKNVLSRAYSLKISKGKYIFLQCTYINYVG